MMTGEQQRKTWVNVLVMCLCMFVLGYMFGSNFTMKPEAFLVSIGLIAVLYLGANL